MHDAHARIRECFERDTGVGLHGKLGTVHVGDGAPQRRVFFDGERFGSNVQSTVTGVQALPDVAVFHGVCVGKCVAPRPPPPARALRRRRPPRRPRRPHDPRPLVQERAARVRGGAYCLLKIGHMSRSAYFGVCGCSLLKLK